MCVTYKTLTIRLNLGQPTSQSTKILNYVKVFQHMKFNDSVVQCVQFVSAFHIQLCDQLEEVLPNLTTNLHNSPDGMAIKIATEDTGTNDKTISSLE